jgi:ATP/maltotriose-dependent transcriptional regulator MalT
VSNQEDKDQTATLGLEAYSRLETAVEGTLAKVSSLEGDLDQARSKVRETEELLRKFSAGEDDPASLNSRRLELEGENKDLLEKLRQGREGVERLLARIRFLEEQG